MRTYRPKAEVEKTCKCGCGRTFMTKNSRRVFFSDYCQLKNMYRNRRESGKMDMVAQQFSRAIRRAYSNLTFGQFCEVIGESEMLNGRLNSYADTKWKAFKDLADDMNTLGTFLDKIVEYGLQDERATLPNS